MFDCRSNRLDYGKMLQPPDGYELESAIATTYSADLGTLLSIPVALIYAHTLEGDFTDARFELLEAIKKFSSRVRVYHQMGRLHVPSKLNWLYAHLEDSLFPILFDDPFASFHPKVWVIRFVSKREPEEEEGGSRLDPRFRVIVLSRNLTFDRSWDVAAMLEGPVGSTPVTTNIPLVDFVSWLHQKKPITEFESFSDELLRTRFEVPESIAAHRFHPIGIPGYLQSPIHGHPSRYSLVVSPFVRAKTVDRVRNNTTQECELIASVQELQNLPSETFAGISAYHLREAVVEAEFMDTAEDGSREAQRQELHAKLYFFWNSGEHRCFLGSANATEPAHSRNVEFVIEFLGNDNRLSRKEVRRQFFGETLSEGPFQSFDPDLFDEREPPDDEAQDVDRRFEHALLKALSSTKAWVDTSANGTNYDVHLLVDLTDVPKDESLAVSVGLLSIRSDKQLQLLSQEKTNTYIFANVGELELSRFMVVHINGEDGKALRRFLVRVDIENLPGKRLTNILRALIDNQDRFFEYLRFLLAEDVKKEDLLASIESQQNGEHPSPVAGSVDHRDLPVFEELLIAASRNPKKLRQVDSTIQELLKDKAASENGEDIIPEAFRSFWQTMREGLQ